MGEKNEMTEITGYSIQETETPESDLFQGESFVDINKVINSDKIVNEADMHLPDITDFCVDIINSLPDYAKKYENNSNFNLALTNKIKDLIFNSKNEIHFFQEINSWAEKNYKFKFEFTEKIKNILHDLNNLGISVAPLEGRRYINTPSSKIDEFYKKYAIFFQNNKE